MNWPSRAPRIVAECPRCSERDHLLLIGKCSRPLVGTRVTNDPTGLVYRCWACLCEFSVTPRGVCEKGEKHAIARPQPERGPGPRVEDKPPKPPPRYPAVPEDMSALLGGREP